jgi:uncharacterized protein YlbG (UPF0298 family)
VQYRVFSVSRGFFSLPISNLSSSRYFGWSSVHFESRRETQYKYIATYVTENEMERTMEELETQVWEKISSSLR